MRERRVIETIQANSYVVAPRTVASTCASLLLIINTVWDLPSMRPWACIQRPVEERLFLFTLFIQNRHALGKFSEGLNRLFI